MKILFSSLIILAIFSCSEQKSTTSSATATITEEQPSASEMAEKGFVAGVIQVSDEDSGCAYTISTRTLSYLLDPTNLDKDFEENNLRVWFKYLPLRMQNRCPDANPVEVSEMTRMK